MAMASDGKQVELWKRVVGVGGGLIAIGSPLLIASRARTSPGHLEAYGLAALIGGLALILLGLAYAFWQQHEWKRPPKLPRGLTCSHYPLQYEPKLHPNHPHIQELAIGVRKPSHPPDFRIFCSAPIRKFEGFLMTTSCQKPSRAT